MTQDGALSNQQIVRAALLVLFGFLASGVLGFVRVAIISQQFGTSATLDAFYAAQRIPEIIFTLVAGGALGSSFIPVYAKLREANSEQAWRLASAVMTLASSAAGLLGLFVAIFALPITEAFLLPGRDAETQALTATLTQMMMVTPFIFSISGLVMGILQSHGIFLLPSIAISMNNIGIIIGALLIAPAMGGTGIAIIDGNNVYGLAWGAILSAVLHLLVQTPGLFQLKARLRPLPDWRMDGVMDVLRLMLPRVWAWLWCK
jgi:putative peptidoglycan lipid II flippase